jgi:hypothetical protein
LLPEHLDDVEDDYEEEEEEDQFARKNLRVVSHRPADRQQADRQAVRQNYDPWKDIYLSGNFDRQRFVGHRRKSDRKSLDYVGYDDDDKVSIL